MEEELRRRAKWQESGPPGRLSPTAESQQRLSFTHKSPPRLSASRARQNPTPNPLPASKEGASVDSMITATFCDIVRSMNKARQLLYDQFINQSLCAAPRLKNSRLRRKELHPPIPLRSSLLQLVGKGKPQRGVRGRSLGSLPSNQLRGGEVERLPTRVRPQTETHPLYPVIPNLAYVARRFATNYTNYTNGRWVGLQNLCNSCNSWPAFFRKYSNLELLPPISID